MLYIVLRKTNQKIYEIKADNVLNEQHERYFSERKWKINQSQYILSVMCFCEKIELESSLQRIF